MVYFLCGLAIGTVMGLTGAGGALVAIPLFMQFLGMGLKEASVYALLAVVCASTSHYLTQRRLTNYRLGLLVVLASALGSALSAPFKPEIPDWAIALMLAAVSFFALYGMWFGAREARGQASERAVPSFLWSLPVGLMLGSLTTFTGLGGGVLMIPTFMGVFGLKRPDALATSLFAVALSSLASLLIQARSGFHVPLQASTALLLSGILGTVFILKAVLRRLGQERMNQLSKVVFTGVVCIALLKIFMGSVGQ